MVGTAAIIKIPTLHSQHYCAIPVLLFDSRHPYQNPHVYVHLQQLHPHHPHFFYSHHNHHHCHHHQRGPNHNPPHPHHHRYPHYSYLLEGAPFWKCCWCVAPRETCFERPGSPMLTRMLRTDPASPNWSGKSCGPCRKGRGRRTK